MSQDAFETVRRLDRVINHPNTSLAERQAAQAARQRVVDAFENRRRPGTPPQNAQQQANPVANPRTANARFDARQGLNVVYGAFSIPQNFNEGLERARANHIPDVIDVPIQVSQEVLGGFSWQYNAAEFAIDTIFGNGSNQEDLSRDSPSEPYTVSGTVPPFTGGQSDGVLYRVRMRMERRDLTTGEVTQVSNPTIAFAEGPIFGIIQRKESTDFLPPGQGSTQWGQWLVHGTPTIYTEFSASSTADGQRILFTNIESVTRSDGGTDTGGNPAPLPVTQQPSAPNRSPGPTTPTELADAPTRNPFDFIPRYDDIFNPPQGTREDQTGEGNESRPENPLDKFVPFVPLIPRNANDARKSPTPQVGTENQNPTEGKNPPCSPGCTQPGVKETATAKNEILEAIKGNAADAASLAAILSKLNAMQGYAEMAWSNTRLQKLINLLTLIGVLHNAAMISREIGETLGYVLSNALAVVGIKDEGGNPLSISELVGQSIEDFAKSVVGPEAYAKTVNNWQKANRVYQAATNIVWTIRSIQDSTLEVAEWIAENTGRIGNALKKFGVVGDRAYPAMPERVRGQDVWRRKMNRVFSGLESLENTSSSLASVTGEVREIQEEFTELSESKSRFKQSLNEYLPDETQPQPAPAEFAPIANANAQAKIDSASPDVAIANAAKGDAQTP